MTPGSQFARVLATADVPQELVPGERTPLDAELFDRNQRLRVDLVVREMARSTEQAGPLLIVTGSDLSLPGCGVLFGFADRSRNIAVVSLFRLRDKRPGVLARRLENEIAHEWEHLQGWSHCKSEGCLMKPVSAAGELEARSLARCGKCPRVRFLPRMQRVAAVAIFFVAVIAFGELTPRLAFLQAFQAPFS